MIDLSHYHQKVMPEGVNSYKAFYNIGIIYECIGKPMQAIHYYKKCNDYSPALDGIARCEKGGQSK